MFPSVVMAAIVLGVLILAATAALCVTAVAMVKFAVGNANYRFHHPMESGHSCNFVQQKHCKCRRCQQATPPADGKPPKT